MRILGIETSCDETGAAVIECSSKDQPVKLLANVLASSLAMHSQTGGIIPEVAAREQVKFILPVIREALNESGIKLNIRKNRIGSTEAPEIDAIAVTYGPGLIGSLLVGVETAKTLGYLWGIPLIPVNHLYGHIYANFIQQLNSKTEPHQYAGNGNNLISGQIIPQFPAIALVVSGGHTDLVLIKNHGDLSVIGGTRDDAAGEAFDKIGRLLGLDYPAGPLISRLAEKGNPRAFKLPRPMWDSKDYDFSFSGLKTAVLNLIKSNNWEFRKSSAVILRDVLENPAHIPPETEKSESEMIPPENSALISDICASMQKAIIDVIIFKTMKAVKEYGVKSLLIGGGVAANKDLRQALESACNKENLSLFIPPLNLCTDNAAMIAAAGYYAGKTVNWHEVSVNPELYY